MVAIDSNLTILLMLQQSMLQLRKPNLKVQLIVLIVLQISAVRIARLAIEVGDVKSANVMVTRRRADNPRFFCLRQGG